MKYTTTEIEEKANRLLNEVLSNVFAKNDMIIGEHPSKPNHEVGIDYFFEIRNRETQESLNIVYNQNKGTYNIIKIKSETHPEYGNISFQLDLKHVKYFINELNKALFFTLCDLEQKKIYWYSIQLDELLQGRILKQEKENKDSLQLYISPANELNLGNFKKFYEELEESDRVQTHKHHKSKLSTEIEYNFEDIKESGLHIIDKIIASIKKFEGLTVIPKHILQKMYPFKGTNDNTFISEETLYTDNDDIYSLFEALERTSDSVKINEDYEISITIDGFENKIEEIFDFFKINLISHFKWRGEGSKDKICIHDLFKFDNSCDCERCNYNSLNFKNAYLKSKKKKDEDSPIEKFKKAYTFYLLGDLKNAYLIYKEIDAYSKDKKSVMLNILCTYNLINLKKLIMSNYFGQDRNEILEELKDVNFVLGDMLIEKSYHRDAFEWIKDNEFINSSNWEIDRDLVEIQNLNRIDKYGGWSRNRQVYEFNFKLRRISIFIEFNLIIYDVFDEFQILVHKSLEGMFALYKIYNPDSTRHDKFHFAILYNWLMHSDFKKINQLLLKYDINEIELDNEDEVFNNFTRNLDNLIFSENIINENRENYLFRDKIRGIIKNFTLIFSRIRMNRNNINYLLDKYLNFISLLEDKFLINLINFEVVFAYRKDINSNNTEKVLKILKDNELLDTESFSACFEYYLKQNFKKSSLKFNKVLHFLGKEVDENLENHFYSNLTQYKNILAIKIFKKEIISLIQKPALKRLKDNFDPKYFYSLLLYDIIPYKKGMYDKYVMSIKDMTKIKTGSEYLIGIKPRKNHNLNNLINLSYKHNLPFTKKIKNLSNYAHESEYYEWLMDLEGFDYTKFNHYWILEYKTSIYFDEFKKHKKLKTEIKKALKIDYIEGVAKIYISYFE